MAFLLSSNKIFSAKDCGYSIRFERVIDACKKEVSEELRVVAWGSMELVNSDQPIRLPELKPAMFFKPKEIKDSLIKVAIGAQKFA